MSRKACGKLVRRLSSVPDPELDEAFQAYRKREQRRRSIFVKNDLTMVDKETIQRNIVMTLCLMIVIVCIIVFVCAYFRMN